MRKELGGLAKWSHLSYPFGRKAGDVELAWKIIHTSLFLQKLAILEAEAIQEAASNSTQYKLGPCARAWIGVIELTTKHLGQSPMSNSFPTGETLGKFSLRFSDVWGHRIISHIDNSTVSVDYMCRVGNFAFVLPNDTVDQMKIDLGHMP